MLFDNRIQKLKESLNKLNLEAIIIAKPENVMYLTGFKGGSGLAVITLNNNHIITDARYTEQAKLEAVGFEIIDQKSNLSKTLKTILEKEAIQEVGFESDFITYHQFIEWNEIITPIKLKATNGIVENLRQFKDKREIVSLKKAAQIADAAFEYILKLLKPGVSERDVANELEYYMKQHGSEKPAFETIIVSGYRSSLPHGVPSTKKIENGDFITLDFGAVYDGYHSDMTRTVVVGKASQEQKKLYNTVLEAQLRSLYAVREGLSCQEVDMIARDYLKEAGYCKEFGHNLGHGIGLAIHEEPRLSPKSNILLAAGMAVTIEPGVYIEGFGGVRIEDSIIVTSTGFEVLTNSTKKLIEL
ncbi:Xaa-Pro peptidase family protein [Bacillota bacterium LX-D]|nr:Xaa-Pro peptidase family protein [Bacillota bacterium LX-D]